MPIRDPIESFRRTARNSPWLVMSILVHAILLVGLGLVAIRHASQAPPDDSVVISLLERNAEPPIEILPPEPIVRHAIPPPLEAGEVVDFTTPVYVPTDVPPDLDLTQPIGDPNAGGLSSDSGAWASTSIGVGPGGVRGGGVSPGEGIRPGQIRGPPGGGRVPLGPTVAIDKAVRDGLVWLARHQNPDGSWSPRSLPGVCDPKGGCSDPKLRATEHYDEGVTALALLCFLGAGYSHETKLDLVDSLRARRHRIGEVVKDALNWLRSRQDPQGSFSQGRAFLYNEALATMALSEAYGLTKNRVWKEPAQRAVDFLQRAQRPSPTSSGRWGWRYASREDVEDPRRASGDPAYAPTYEKELHDSDTSVTAWCVMALKSAQLSRLQVDPAAFDGAVEFCRFVTPTEPERAGLVGYLDSKTAGEVVTGPFDGAFAYHRTTMSALGMCIRIFARRDALDPFLVDAAKRIVQDLPAVAQDGSSVDYYYWYYASLALNQLDGPDSPRPTGKYWNPWNRAMVDALLALQDRTQGSCRSGGWTTNDRWSSASGTGAIYDTAMSVLTLEVYYRYPNAFGRKPH